ncbi:hypothetical protein ACSV5K_10315 [Agrobacterium pusense]|uniref:hypothetical protein n=1 Tax=Agrobacterium pusense TaxID=648995 RepID=UPI003FD4CAA5
MAHISEIVTANSPRHIIENRISLQEQRIAANLSKYEPISAMAWWLDIIRAVEEVFNLGLAGFDDETFEELFFHTPLAEFLNHPELFLEVRRQLTHHYSETFANRICNLIALGVSMSWSFSQQGVYEPVGGLQSFAHMVGYFQSRRRHFVALLHMMPTACRGTLPVTQLDAFANFLPIVELDGIQLMGAQNALLEHVATAKLGITGDLVPRLQMLNKYFLEPERAGVTDMPITSEGHKILEQREPQPKNALFSAAELRNDILVVRAAYAEFDLTATDFEPVAALIDKLSREYVERDFWVKISPKQLDKLFNDLQTPASLRKAIINHSRDYVGCLSTYSPFVLMNGHYSSTVSLLSRFMYHWRGRTLDQRKRFQIRSGFIFEDAVAKALEEQGFVHQNITRVNGSEFDVVTVRDGVIWNIQCKNNFVALAQVEHDADRFARFNRLYVRAYEKALEKERQREDMLTSKLSINSIQHMLVSKFPVITNNPRIIPFSRIGEFSDRANALLGQIIGT